MPTDVDVDAGCLYEISDCICGWQPQSGPKKWSFEPSQSIAPRIHTHTHRLNRRWSQCQSQSWRRIPQSQCQCQWGSRAVAAAAGGGGGVERGATRRANKSASKAICNRTKMHLDATKWPQNAKCIHSVSLPLQLTYDSDYTVHSSSAVLATVHWQTKLCMLTLVWPLVELISLFFGKEFNFRIMLAFDSNGETRKELELNSIILSLILNRS